MSEKTLDNTTADQASKQVSDLKIWGNGDTFKLICKASSKAEGWMKSTKAMQIDGVGCIVQVSTQQINETGMFVSERDEEASEQAGYTVYKNNTRNAFCSAVAEAVTFVPGVMIEEIYSEGEEHNVVSRRLIPITRN
jgi:hypothetical protein